MSKSSNKKGPSAPQTGSNVATAAPAATPEAPVKAKRAPAVVQNGVTRPRAGGLCAAVWEITEGLAAKDGTLPDIAAVKAKAEELKLNPTNVSIEFYRCRQFHGVRGRKPKADQAATA